MLIKMRAAKRRGATMTEAAFVLPFAFFFVFGLIVGSFGVFRYQQMASMAREGTRYASVHGGQYSQETGNTAATTQDIKTYILTKAAVLDSAKLTVTVTLNTSSGSTPWDTSNKMPYTVSGNGNAHTNTVTVTVSYQWSPEYFLVGPINLTSTSTIPMSY